ncbi:carbonic anhydrase 2-like [Physella acuta]|uniref:carbonic anhydrase 2-like n=1 Tax=Physella acuta TaxID=109671 RepID=UPI0027DC520E|nr:carbonic anhydrase 2-like [Physella acuta]XP_059162364.1 carbonic anhydrase 2-like [Physella acuta]XP_059162365.1 carbonic anhydrase 2-like [Physella acuta]XP_059162366.1 carbonic anhydrase 2-like [Physella acuta]XP_059162367.1 carbonic anhydrase 2-like [Physella acuta]XP_059162368.1 carbonic anhydrase 2-like [Physella acuta]XP_059162369.1 carbonic anhydrase 2-like [Physella acuta]XP_059162370.1 carbonic anhydrase 2-like [Physella acuta]XP_059162372.1 carbonic anhydrase 2-like [Physella 
MARPGLDHICFYLLPALLVYPVLSHDGEWNYDPRGPDGPSHWYQKYPQCAGSFQSPIEISTDEVVYDPTLAALDLSDYSNTRDVKMRLVYLEGHTVQLIFSGKPLYLRGGGLSGEYQLDQLHFHWGSSAASGSEHLVDWKSYPLELHIVHHQRKMGNFTVASSQPYGVAVLGILFKLSKVKNENWDKFLGYLKQVPSPGDEYDVPTFALKDLIPSSAGKNFYRYIGSLTTPPCTQPVIWSIAANFIELSDSQLLAVHRFRDQNGALLEDTYRHIQNLEGRRVLTTIRRYPYNRATHTIGQPVLLVLGLILLYG